MDRYCDTCGHTTHDGIGKCRFCGTPFPAEPEKSETAPETVDNPPSEV